MKKPVLFIQGAGEGAYTEDEKLAASLQAVLGTEYQVLYSQATIREFDGRRHQFNNDLSEVASDIATLQKEEI
jgi:hypothetical protein